jgi:serine/threonine-protein kinase RsbW
MSAKRRAAGHWFQLELPSDLDALPWLSHGLRGFLRAAGWNRRDMFRIDLAVNEAVHNAMVHGNRRSPGKTVELRVHDDTRRTVFEVVDRGTGFEPADLQSLTERNRDLLEGGRGVALMVRLMDSVEVIREPWGTRVRMVKAHPEAAALRRAG